MNIWIFMRVVTFVVWWQSFSPSEQVALFGAFLVFVGVVGEEVIELKFWDEPDRSKAKGRIKRWSIAILILGLACDVIGIVMGQAEMAAITKEAGDAKQAASDAFRIAGLAKGDSKTALTNAGTANTTAVAAGNTAAKAVMLASSANITADLVGQKAAVISGNLDAATDKVARIEAFLTPRHLSPDETKALSDDLKPLADPNVSIVVYMSEKSASGVQVYRALFDAGFSKTTLEWEADQIGMRMQSPLEHAYLAGQIARMLLKRSIGPMMGTIYPTPPGTPIAIHIDDIHSEYVPKKR